MIGLAVLMIRLMFEMFEWSIKLTIWMVRLTIIAAAWTFKMTIAMCVAIAAMIKAMSNKTAQ